MMSRRKHHHTPNNIIVNHCGHHCRHNCMASAFGHVHEMHAAMHGGGGGDVGAGVGVGGGGLHRAHSMMAGMSGGAPPLHSGGVGGSSSNNNAAPGPGFGAGPGLANPFMYSSSSSTNNLKGGTGGNNLHHAPPHQPHHPAHQPHHPHPHHHHHHGFHHFSSSSNNNNGSSSIGTGGVNGARNGGGIGGKIDGPRPMQASNNGSLSGRAYSVAEINHGPHGAQAHASTSFNVPVAPGGGSVASAPAAGGRLNNAAAHDRAFGSSALLNNHPHHPHHPDSAGPQRGDGILARQCCCNNNNSNNNNNNNSSSTNSRNNHISNANNNGGQHALPVLILWDVENVQMPREVPVSQAVRAVRAYVQRSLPGRDWFEVDFAVACDVFRQQTRRIDEMNDAQITVIHVNSMSKNAADMKLKLHMHKFASTFKQQSACVVLISGDVNFAPSLYLVRHHSKLQVIVLHNHLTPPALLEMAHHAEDFYRVLMTTPHVGLQSGSGFGAPPCRPHKNNKAETNHLMVANLPEEVETAQILRRLHKMASNTGGRVLEVRGSLALMRFPSAQNAARALSRMNDRDVCGQRVRLYFVDEPGRDNRRTQSASAPPGAECGSAYDMTYQSGSGSRRYQPEGDDVVPASMRGPAYDIVGGQRRPTAESTAAAMSCEPLGPSNSFIHRLHDKRRMNGMYAPPPADFVDVPRRRLARETMSDDNDEQFMASYTNNLDRDEGPCPIASPLAALNLREDTHYVDAFGCARYGDGHSERGYDAFSAADSAQEQVGGP